MMISMRLNLSVWMRPVRLLLGACACVLLLFSQAMPAYSSPKSDPTGGEANLTKIELEAQKAVLSDPYNLEETQEKAIEGLNEIQGTADAEKMKRPENTRGAESIEQKIQKALEKAEGKTNNTVDSGKDLADKAADKVNDTVESGKGLVGKAADKVNETVEAGKGLFGKAGDKVNDTVESGKDLARSPKSSPTEGEANLTKIELEAQKAVLSDPYNLEETQAKAVEGLNEIQGTADAEKMKRPENTTGAKSIEQKIQKALEKAEGKY